MSETFRQTGLFSGSPGETLPQPRSHFPANFEIVVFLEHVLVDLRRVFLHRSNEISTFLMFEGCKKCMSAQDCQGSSSGVRFSEGSVFCVGLMKYQHFLFSYCFSCCICGPICQHAKHPSEVRKTSNFIRPVQKIMPSKITLAECSGLLPGNFVQNSKE